ncbi:MAG: hypothetical protein H6632_09845 [Anaerolineales bacterium]|nr:hypothetical protein [Anaerolineales bacterium]
MVNWLKVIVLLVMLTTPPFTGALSHPAAATTDLTFQVDQPDIPQIEAIYNFGVPAGNAATPRFLALDSQAGLAYILSEGQPSLKEGNGLSRFDLKSGEIVDHVKINEGDNEPLDLQIDSTTGLIYALWREKFSDVPATLSVIDSASLETPQAITGLKSMAAAAGLLYTADDERLTRYDTGSGTLTKAQEIDLSAATTGPMAVDQTNDRLYLARASEGVWHLEIYKAGTLDPVTTYPAEGPILDIFPTPKTQELLLIVNLNEFMMLYRLTLDGELADFPYEIGPRYGPAGIALSADEQVLYYSKGPLAPAAPADSNAGGPALGRLAVGTLLPLDDIALLTPVEAIAVDPATQQALALYPYDHLLYRIDPEQASYELTSTAIELRDVLVDPESNHIFISDSANRIRLLDGDSLAVLAETTLTGNTADYGFKLGRDSGELSLDAGRQRLYISGYPATVVDSGTLLELATLEPGGQIAPDPTGDNIYLSHCGVTLLAADTLSGDTLLPQSGPRPDGLAPNPCVAASRLDADNQWLYSITPNGTPGSNGGSYLYVYDLTLEPTLAFTDTDISIVSAEPDPVGQRAFVTYLRNSNRRLRTLDMAATLHPAYANQLLGVFGDTHYNPAANRLYLSDRDQPRLLTLEAGTLNVLGETRLPPNHAYRLAAIDPATNRLFLIGIDGQLVVAAMGADPNPAIEAEITAAPAEPRQPDGSVLGVERPGATTIARIESSVGDFSFEPRLYLSRDKGQTWQDLSEKLPPLPVKAVAVSPDFETDQTMFVSLLAAGQTGGLYKSTDGGETWTAAMNGLRDLWVEALYISPNFSQDQLIFARTTYAGLHQSLDGGETWTALTAMDPNAPFPAANSANSIAFSDNGLVLASQSLPQVVDGLFLTTVQADGSLSEWLQVLDVSAERLAFSPQGDVALAFGGGLWRSVDGGLSWEAGGAGLTGIDNLTPTQILFSPNFETNQTVYFFFRDTSGAKTSMLFRSTDAGQTWQPWQKPFIDRNFASATLTPDGDFIFGEENGALAQLRPGAIVWTTPRPAPQNFPIDDLAVVAKPTGSTLFIVSRQNGLDTSDDGGQTWRQTAFPVRDTSYGLTKYRLAVSPHFAADKTLYIATGRSLHRSTDGGQTWAQIPLVTDKSSEALTFRAQRVVFSPNYARDKTLLAGTAGAVYRSADSGQTWTEVLTSAGDSSAIDLLAIAPDGDTAYARFGYSQSLFTSDDGGQTWQAQVTPDEYFSLISSAVGPDNTLTAALEFDTRLLQTGRQPASQPIIAGPSQLTSLLAVAYAADGTLFTGGQGGIVRSDDNGQTWQPIISRGLPSNAEITSLKAAGNHLFAATTTGQIFVSADEGKTWQDISVVK